MESQPVNPVRLVIYNVLGCILIACFLLFIGSLLSTSAMSHEAQQRAAEILSKFPPPFMTDDTPSYESLVKGWAVVEFILMIVCGILLGTVFKKEAAYMNQRQAQNFKQQRIGMGIVLPALIAAVMSIMMAGFTKWTILVFAVIFFLARKSTMMMAVEPGKALLDSYKGLGLDVTGDPNPMSTVPLVGVGEYAGLKTRLVQYTRYTGRNNNLMMYEIAQIETSDKSLELVMETGEINADDSYAPVDGIAGLGGMLSNYNAVSNDPLRAYQFISANQQAIENLLSWATAISVNVSPGEPDVINDSYFDNAGMITLIRDEDEAVDCLTLNEMLDGLIGLSRSLSSAIAAP